MPLNATLALCGHKKYKETMIYRSPIIGHPMSLYAEFEQVCGV